MGVKKQTIEVGLHTLSNGQIVVTLDSLLDTFEKTGNVHAVQILKRILHNYQAHIDDLPEIMDLDAVATTE